MMIRNILLYIREGGIVFGAQVIRKNFSVPLRFYQEPLMLSSKPHNMKSVQNLFYLMLKTNSAEYHDGMHCCYL